MATVLFFLCFLLECASRNFFIRQPASADTCPQLCIPVDGLDVVQLYSQLRKDLAHAVFLFFPSFPWIAWATSSAVSLCTSLFPKGLLPSDYYPLKRIAALKAFSGRRVHFPPALNEHFKCPLCILSSLGTQPPTSLRFSLSTF